MTEATLQEKLHANLHANLHTNLREELREALHIDARVDRDTVALGEGFALQVTRSWPTSVAVLPFDESALAPLVVVRGRVSKDVSDDVSTEVRMYTAYAFGLERVETAPLVLRIRTASGDVRATEGAPIVLRVTSALGDGAGLKVELPTESLPIPSPDLGPTLLASLLSMAMVAGWIAYRRCTSPPICEAPLSPLARAHERLSSLEQGGRRGWRMRHIADELAHIAREILRGVAKPNIPVEMQARHTDLIASLDRARFAADRVDPTRVSAWMVETRALLDAVRSEEALDPRADSASPFHQQEVGA